MKRDPKIVRCFVMGCGNPVSVEAKELGGILPACSRHGGETRIVWSVYRQGHGWLTDNDTIVDWNHDVDQARWFPEEKDAWEFLLDEIEGPDAAKGPNFAIVRLK